MEASNILLFSAGTHRGSLSKSFLKGALLQSLLYVCHVLCHLCVLGAQAVMARPIDWIIQKRCVNQFWVKRRERPLVAVHIPISRVTLIAFRPFSWQNRPDEEEAARTDLSVSSLHFLASLRVWDKLSRAKRLREGGREHRGRDDLPLVP